ncbi:hypothetical protein BLNAU_20112 [Blattamonas nauphoetae]|uniref:Uncharacterized protein n=1 Tax=Blattamonas nauphoetae TaxID=2049346 RepID=A0ABQ9X2T5_9EUKA|nr:hypothetical protein BLNAU_20112 [Blattamonas nauphoetae]
MKMINSLIFFCSAEVLHALVNADLFPQLVISLNPLSLPFAEAVDSHMNVMRVITNSLWLSTPDGLEQLEIEDNDRQQTVHETILKQVILPSEKYIWHLWTNRFSIIDGEQSLHFLDLLAHLLQISPYYEPTMAFIVNMHIFLTIPSCLTFFEKDDSINYFLTYMVDVQQNWNEKRGAERQMWMPVHRMLRTEGLEDVIEEKLRTDRKEYFGRSIVYHSIKWNNLLCMNLPE